MLRVYWQARLIPDRLSMKDLEIVLLKLLKGNSFSDNNINCSSHRLALEVLEIVLLKL